MSLEKGRSSADRIETTLSPGSGDLPGTLVPARTAGPRLSVAANELRVPLLSLGLHGDWRPVSQQS